MQEEERNRYISLINTSNEVFERLGSSISTLHSRNISLISLNFALLSIIFAAISFGVEQNWVPSARDICLLGLISVFLLSSLIINIFIFHPTDYKDLEIFKKERFDELRGMDEQTLLSDILYHLKEAFEYNEKKYEKRLRWFIIAFYSFIIANTIIISLLIKNLI